MLKDLDRENTSAEHLSIILNYNKTKLLDRKNAIKKYIDFNKKYPEYNEQKEVFTTLTHSSIQIEHASDEVIVNNLYSQLLWFSGSGYLKSYGI